MVKSDGGDFPGGRRNRSRIVSRYRVADVGKGEVQKEAGANI